MINLNDKHHKYMQIALDEAKKAYQENEIPVGAIIANNEKIIAVASNKIEKLKNPLMHAEILAINQACQLIGEKYLNNYNIYVTLEPCELCINAIKIARIKKIFFSTSRDEKYGLNCNNKNIETYGEILETEATKMLKKFFINLRDI